ncbi:cytochrome C [Caminibacter mediatlanticus TB-2]|uniref:Cytochrome c-type protein n=1 Tax=Caminibacter mediatlanticus TB-2 TaxID=391592 RepID=A0ABX5VBV5_9BACT|nr:NapC/NirT family cytochrome c [Caminibacter mediatlanticus]QCT94371.1 cytochrome C [Caminibacter mediatlanticus TB-2]
MKKATLGALIAGAVIGLGISYVTAIMVDKTSTPEFCASCHTMKPMVDSFKFSVHGGNNPQGFAATHCTDCHLPHNSLIGYLIAKGISGTRDALAEFGIIKKVDFKDNFWEMDKYVYDSGCLKCHKGIEKLKDKNVGEVIGLTLNSQKVHKEFYWNKKERGEKVSCVACHNDNTMTHFAHPNLLETLQSE